jgi:hypothetical protein
VSPAILHFEGSKQPRLCPRTLPQVCSDSGRAILGLCPDGRHARDERDGSVICQGVVVPLEGTISGKAPVRQGCRYMLLSRKLLSKCWVLSAFVIVFASAVASPKHYSGIVHGSLPRFDFAINEVDTGENNGGKRITSIEIRSSNKLVQTIRFEDDENAPIDFAPGDLVTLEDVDCDGYKDLLVRSLVGVHGDAWYHIYRFNTASHHFIEYAPFTTLAYSGVNCHTKLVKTYVNSGAAGCIYEAGWYHWVGGALLPVRIESQEGGEDGSFQRTIKVWRNGKEVVLSSTSVSANDCHARPGAVGKQKE